MRKNIILTPLLAAALLVPATLPAADPLTLDGAIRQALAHNPDLGAVAEYRDAAASEARASRGARLPSVDLKHFVRRSDNPLDAFADKLNTRSVTAGDLAPAAINNPATSTVHATAVTLEWPLYTGGQVSAGIRAADDQASAAQLRWQRARQLTVWQTIATYRDAQAAAEALRIADEAVVAAEGHAKTTARLVRERRAPASDPLTADVQLAMLKSRREQAAAQAAAAMAQLRRVLGLAPAATLVIEPWAEPSPNPAPAAAGQPMRPDLAAQQRLADASRERVRQARSVFHPQVGVVASQSWFSDRSTLENESRSVMGVVSINLFRGGRDHHTLTAARHAELEAALRARSLAQQVESEIATARARLDEARSRYEICADNVGKAQRTVEIVRGRYGEGRTILIDLLQAERQLVEARMEKLATSQALVTAEATLRLAEGSLEVPE